MNICNPLYNINSNYLPFFTFLISLETPADVVIVSLILRVNVYFIAADHKIRIKFVEFSFDMLFTSNGGLEFSQQVI